MTVATSINTTATTETTTTMNQNSDNNDRDVAAAATFKTTTPSHSEHPTPVTSPRELHQMPTGSVQKRKHSTTLTPQLLSHSLDQQQQEQPLAEMELVEESSLVATPAVDAQEKVDYTFAWSVATQKGYRYPNAYTRDRKLDIHTEMEDFHYPSQNETPNNLHPLTGKTYQLFMLADGHGGHACARFAVQRLPLAVIELVNSRVWNVRSQEDQQLMRSELQRIFLQLDEEYCNRKLAEYRRWIMPLLANNENPNDLKHRGTKPPDDGCTVVVNILYESVLINCNVGDSRSVLLRSQKNSNAWVEEFVSTDHTPGHPVKAHQIHSNGGRYMLNGATTDISRFVDECFQADTWNGKIQYESPEYDYLSNCRVGRPAGWRISEIDLQACTTLNLTGTMGDLFFKYNPALINACPDVTFSEMSPKLGNRQYMLVMATDGVWDHMRTRLPGVQQMMITDFVRKTMHSASRLDFYINNNNNENNDGSCNENMSDVEDMDTDNIETELRDTLRKLGVLAHGLCDREMTQCNSDLFTPGYIRYDDCTAFVVLID